MKASIIVQLSLGTDTYNINLTLPQGSPSADKPFLFGVEKVGVDAVSKPLQEDPLLQVAIGIEGQFFVAVQPPKSLIEGAGAAGLVKNLQVVVAEGEYNVADKQFKTAEAISGTAG